VILRLACSNLLLAQAAIDYCCTLQERRLSGGGQPGRDTVDSIALHESYIRRAGCALARQPAANDCEPPLEAA
jgi:hypothetical protein